jgi:hypothetical protein
MTPHRVKFSRRALIDIIFAALSLALIVGVSVLTIHRYPRAKMLASAPIAIEGSVTH